MSNTFRKRPTYLDSAGTQHNLVLDNELPAPEDIIVPSDVQYKNDFGNLMGERQSNLVAATIASKLKNRNRIYGLPIVSSNPISNWVVCGKFLVGSLGLSSPSITIFNTSTNISQTITMPVSASFTIVASAGRYAYTFLNMPTVNTMFAIDTVSLTVSTIILPSGTTNAQYAVCGKYVVVVSTNGNHYIIDSSTNNTITSITGSAIAALAGLAIVDKKAYIIPSMTGSVQYIDTVAKTITTTSISIAINYSYITVAGKYIFMLYNSSVNQAMTYIDTTTNTMSTIALPLAGIYIIKVLAGNKLYFYNSAATATIYYIDTTILTLGTIAMPLSLIYSNMVSAGDFLYVFPSIAQTTLYAINIYNNTISTLTLPSSYAYTAFMALGRFVYFTQTSTPMMYAVDSLTNTVSSHGFANPNAPMGSAAWISNGERLFAWTSITSAQILCID